MSYQPEFDLETILQTAPVAAARETEITVSQLSQRISTVLNRYADFSGLWITGEISNCKQYPSGHIYFVLKDREAQLNCTMFRDWASRLNFAMKEGQQVRLQGKASLYAPSGRFQFLVQKVELAGSGALYAKYLELKNKLEAEGLFVKRSPLPLLPKRVGVVTSPKGAVIQDICNVTFRRFPGAKILLFPAAVQGVGAAEQICAGVSYFNRQDHVDVIIVARGGGSIEDLWCFNDEVLARTIFASKIPVVSGVGHETDYTLCDFVADHRAPTPSAAAELVWPDRQNLSLKVQKLSEQLQLQQDLYLQHRRMQVSTYKQPYTLAGYQQFLQNKNMALFRQSTQLERFNPAMVLQKQKLILAQLSTQLTNLWRQSLGKKQHLFALQEAKLKHLDPHAILERGYAIITDDQGEIIRQVAAVKEEQLYTWHLFDGQIDVRVRKCGNENES